MLPIYIRALSSVMKIYPTIAVPNSWKFNSKSLSIYTISITQGGSLIPPYDFWYPTSIKRDQTWGALTWKRGTGMCGPQDPLFTPLLPFTRSPVEAQICSQNPHLKEKCDISPPKATIFYKIWQFSAPEAQIWPSFLSKSLKILQNISSQALFGWKYAHKPPLSRQFIRPQAPKFGNPGHIYLPEKKLSALPNQTTSFLNYTQEQDGTLSLGWY